MAEFSRGQFAQMSKRCRKGGVTCPDDFKQNGPCTICGHDFLGGICQHSLAEVHAAIEKVLVKVS